MESARKREAVWSKPYIFGKPLVDRGSSMDEGRLRKIIEDPEKDTDMKESAILASAESGSRILPVLKEFIRHENPKIKSAISSTLGRIGGRQVYEPLLELIQDPDVYKDALEDLGTARDSRAIFVFANLYNSLEPKGRKAVLYAFEKLADPRAVDFLAGIAETAEGSDISEIAQEAAEKSRRNTYFSYTFVWDEETRKKAEQKEGRILVAGKADLQRKEVADILKDFASFHRPQTYVVALDGKFYIGGNVQEHVEVAKGEDVLTAGEVEFDLETFDVAYINNRSNGFYPGKTSFRWIKEALAGTDIRAPEDFSEVFPRDGFTCDDILHMFPFYNA
ncbi:hypothetical protein GF371_02865 [Candidatus Woesearchaeota archaeon]|nr:hypothetical protein [Candidatus Woesearchaeota archaeon]